MEPVTFLRQPKADLAEPRAGLRQFALQLPAPRGCQVAPTLALYGQNCPTKPGFAESFLSILGPWGSVGLSPQLSLAQTSARAARTLDATWGVGGVSLSPQPQGGGDH